MLAGSSKVLSKRLPQKLEDVVEDVQDWENHIVLRVPPDVVEKVNRLLEDNPSGQIPKDELAIAFTSTDMRHARIRLGDYLMSAKIYDLPCICEVMKTIDKKVVYKVADLSQIMACSHDLADTVSTKDAKSAKKEQKQWQYPHGLTPPMKSVRVRRFRKTKKKRFMDAPEVEKELKRLLRADLEADSVRWEIVTADEKKKQVEPMSDAALFGDKVSSSEDEEEAPQVSITEDPAE
ncbi:hypothetical protein WR25_07122 [Diploscapter pachys]|uniref:TAFII55 protein conserved region domain-containing protein n=1 Tax=Diploscapter pachys TaxID=2018661 RepID=A0A2A2JEP5_9BILA|nr:hypothetical protein WR25_07122 [Diploscapter pachys]